MLARTTRTSHSRPCWQQDSWVSACALLHPVVRRQPVSGGSAAALVCCAGAPKRKPQPSGADGDDVGKLVLGMADKYLGQVFSPPRAAQQPAPGGIHYLLAALIATWALGNALGAPAASKLLALEGPAGWHKWWAVLMDALWSRTPEALARSVFMGYVFGRTVEGSEGPQGLWLAYFLSGAGGALAACLLLPRRAPIQGSGSAGALFGLFLLATLFNRRKTWHWQRFFELGVLGPFLVLQLLGSTAACAQWCVVGGTRAGAWVPLLGGAVGASVVAALLHLARLVAAATVDKQRQQQPTTPALAPEDLEPVTLLLNKLAAFVLKRVL